MALQAGAKEVRNWGNSALLRYQGHKHSTREVRGKSSSSFVFFATILHCPPQSVVPLTPQPQPRTAVDARRLGFPPISLSPRHGKLRTWHGVPSHTPREQIAQKPVQRIMKSNWLKVIGLSAALVVLGAVWVVELLAQPSMNKPSVASLTTKWVGVMVVGKDDAMDPIAPGPHPSVVREVQIGLRSDGVVVWRSGSKAK